MICNHVNAIITCHNFVNFHAGFSSFSLKRVENNVVIKKNIREEKKKGQQGETDGPDVGNLCRADRWPRQKQCMQTWQIGLDGNMKYLEGVNGGGCSRLCSLSSQDCLDSFAFININSVTGTQSVSSISWPCTSPVKAQETIWWMWRPVALLRLCSLWKFLCCVIDTVFCFGFFGHFSIWLVYTTPWAFMMWSRVVYQRTAKQGRRFFF